MIPGNLLTTVRKYKSSLHYHGHINANITHMMSKKFQCISHELNMQQIHKAYKAHCRYSVYLGRKKNLQKKVNFLRSNMKTAKSNIKINKTQ